MLNLIGMGYSHAKVEMTNQFIENLGINTTAEWIKAKIGIESRVVSMPLTYIEATKNEDPRKAVFVAETNASILGIEAGLNALRNTGLKPSDIGLVIVNCCTPVKLGQTEAQRIARGLGISAPSYDVFSACPAFALHMDYLRNFKEEELPDYVLCISTATMSQHVNYNERSDGAIWGDGASACIISPRVSGRLSVTDTFFTTDCSRCHAVVVKRYGHFWQDGRAIRDFSVRQTVRLIKVLEEKYNLDWSRDIFIGHQANLTMLKQITGNRRIPDENHWFNVSHLGNQAGAGCAAVLAMNWEKLQKGQRILIAVVGAGLSWGAVLLEVAT